MKKQRAVIIGGGLAGIATALRLQSGGWQTTICEAGPTFGGKMNRWIRDGFVFDTGPSLITMPWVFRETFAAAGARLEDYVDLVPLNPIAEYRFDDGTRFEYTSHVPTWIDTLKRIAPDDLTGFFRFLNLGARLFGVSQQTFFRRSPFEAPAADQWRAMRNMPLRHAWGNYQKAVEHYFKSPYLRQLYGRYPTYVGSSPHLSPATLAVIPYIEFAYGGYSVRGGLYRIVEALLSLARDRGVELLVNSRVARILVTGRSANGVELASGDRLDADVVVMNGDFATTAELLGKPKAPPAKSRSMSGFVMLLGIDKELPDTHQHTVLFSSDYKREFSQIFDERRFPDDPTVYINVPSRGDRSLVPGQGETIFVMANAPATDDIWDEARIGDARRRIFERMSRAGFPAFEDNIVVSDVWTPSRISSQYQMPGGAIYGTDSHGWRNAFLRPRNVNPDVAGLYHVGGSTHPGGGTPTVLMSAAITSRMILERHGEGT